MSIQISVHLRSSAVHLILERKMTKISSSNVTTDYADFDCFRSPGSDRPAVPGTTKTLTPSRTCCQSIGMDDFKTTGGETWSDYLTKAVHDMRSPLSSMRVALEVMSVTGGDPERRVKLVEILNSNVDELAHQLEALMDALPHHVSKVPGGKDP
jgi:hypothetical protein